MKLTSETKKPGPKPRKAPIEDLIKSAKDGMSASAIGQKWGLNRETARERLLEVGIKTHGRPGIPAVKVDIGLAVKMFTGGASTSDIRKKLGVTRSVLGKRLSEGGISLRQINADVYSRKLDRVGRDEWAWLAGFFDGDGSAGVIWRGKYYGVIVTFTNTKNKALLWINNLLGGHLGKVSTPNKRQKDCFRIQFTDRQAELVCCRLIPFLRVRKRQAQILVQFMEAKRAKRISDMSSLREELGRLNKRGC